jgi:hypothetical protein
VAAEVAILDARLDIDPDVIGMIGANLLPQRPGLRLVSRAHQLPGQFAQHLGALGVATAGDVTDSADRVFGPAERQIAVGKVLTPGRCIEPRLVLVGGCQRQVLLQGGGPLGVIVTGLLHPVHDLVDALLQR